MFTITCSTMHRELEPETNTTKLSKGTQQQEQQMDQEQPVASRTRRLSSTGSRGNLEVSDQLNRTATNDSANADVVEGAIDASLVPTIKELAEIHQKDPLARSEKEQLILQEYAFLVPNAKAYLKAKQEKELLRQRLLEVEESRESIEAKTDILAKLIKESRHVVIYTGAGISTSASIPDYRGPNGLWTQIKRTGSFSITKIFDLSNAEPTYTHMAIKELCRRRIVKHVVSQNCDGLHLRSGIKQNNLSEIHGNMYIEVCPTCERQYFREADVTQQTCRFRHKTGRKCHSCLEPNNNLIDTIVLYGERSRTKWPMNWDRASKAAKNADLIICMGSSLKTLRRYGCLWPSSSTKKAKSETKLVIINLQHTPKDKNAFMKINGKCDFVMENVMQRLGVSVPQYDWSGDPLLRLAVPFTTDELAHLKRNLISDSRDYERLMSKQQTLPPPHDDPLSPSSSKRPKSKDSRESPSLFVSELTDDPDRKRLRMRIRAVNVGAAGSCKAIDENSVTVKQDPDLENKQIETIDIKELDEHDSENVSQLNVEHQHHQHHDHHHHHHHRHRIVEYSPPGWLGKSLGHSKTSSYRRKRHGNKGRKRSVATVATDPALEPAAPLPAQVPQEA